MTHDTHSTVVVDEVGLTLNHHVPAVVESTAFSAAEIILYDRLRQCVRSCGNCSSRAQRKSMLSNAQLLQMNLCEARR